MKTTAFMGEPDLRSVRLTARERATIAQAATILETLRAALEDGREDFDDETVIDVALAAHTCRFVASETAIDIRI